jgi:hypothetical protein
MKNLEDVKVKELMRLESALTSQDEAIENTKTLLSAQKEERERLVAAMREEIRTLNQTELELVSGKSDKKDKS